MFGCCRNCCFPRNLLLDEEDWIAVARYFDGLQKVTLLGDPNVGKSSLLACITNKTVCIEYKPTIGANFSNRRISIPSIDSGKLKSLTLQIWEISGDIKYKSIAESYARGAYKIMLVFDVTNEESFKHLHDWAALSSIGKSSNKRAVLVGNKCDLVKDRVITVEMALVCAQQLGIDTYLDVSALYNIRVDDAFVALAAL